MSYVWRDQSYPNMIIDYIVMFSTGVAGASVFKTNISTSIGSMSLLQKFMLSAAIIEELKMEPDHMRHLLSIFKKRNQEEQPILLEDNQPSKNSEELESEAREEKK